MIRELRLLAALVRSQEKCFASAIMGPLATEDNVQFFLKEFGKALKAEGYSA